MSESYIWLRYKECRLRKNKDIPLDELRADYVQYLEASHTRLTDQVLSLEKDIVNIAQNLDYAEHEANVLATHVDKYYSAIKEIRALTSVIDRKKR